MADILLLLDQIRSIAQTGLFYTQNPYDKERYQHLLELAVNEYSTLTGLPTQSIVERFQREIGYITPKVGVDGAVFDDDGRILLVRRSDDHKWCLPCGWAEVGLTPQENVKREVHEETGLDVEVRELIDVITSFPDQHGALHSGYGLIYHCVAIGGSLTPSHETPELGYFDYTQISEWHTDHRLRAERAYRFWHGRNGKNKG